VVGEIELSTFNPLVASSSLAQPTKFAQKNDLLKGKSFFLPAISRMYTESLLISGLLFFVPRFNTHQPGISQDSVDY